MVQADPLRASRQQKPCVGSSRVLLTWPTSWTSVLPSVQTLLAPPGRMELCSTMPSAGMLKSSSSGSVDQALMLLSQRLCEDERMALLKIGVVAVVAYPTM